MGGIPDTGGQVTEPTATYAVSLLRLRGVGRRTVVQLLTRYPSESDLLAASESELAAVAGPRVLAALVDGLAHGWAIACDLAAHDVELHERAGIGVIPFGAGTYPALLAAAPDPPAVLYVKGDASSMSARLTVAVVGTRQPTQRGWEIGKRVARRFAEQGAVIVSGLAKGIDTAGHEGALEVGRTVAVLGTAIDKIYPAENAELSKRIELNGALVSEYPIGFVPRATAFVERDRIQAGLSLAVIPVQTGIDGGTQHTIKYAIAAGRRVLCPRPSEAELGAPENEGILALIREGRGTAFERDDIDKITGELAELGAQLVRGDTGDAPRARGAAESRAGRKSKLVEAGAQGQLDWLVPQVASSAHSIPLTCPDESKRAPVATHRLLTSMDEVVGALDETLDRVGPDYDEEAFDAIVRAWRVRRYPDR